MPLRLLTLRGFLLLSWSESSLLTTSTNVKVDQERIWLARLRPIVESHLGQMHGLRILHGDAELRNIVATGDGGDYAATACLVDYKNVVTKGRFARRLAKDYKGMDEKDVERNSSRHVRERRYFVSSSEILGLRDDYAADRALLTISIVLSAHTWY